jgi:hypothetical protein
VLVQPEKVAVSGPGSLKYPYAVLESKVEDRYCRLAFWHDAAVYVRDSLIHFQSPELCWLSCSFDISPEV